MQRSIRLLLVRHGQTEWHHENRYTGITDLELTETGRLEARALAERARKERPNRIMCSPMSRAVETARPAAEACGLDLHVDDRLREVDFGDWEGKTLDEMREIDPSAVERFESDPHEHPFQNGEPLPVAAQRLLEVFGELHHSHAGDTVFVVAHNTLLRIGLCALLGIPIPLYRHRIPRLLNGAISEVRLHGPADGGLYTLNDACHLQLSAGDF